MPITIAPNGQEILSTEIVYFGHACIVVCDRKCEKAWGHNGKRAAIRDDGGDEDDVIWFADSEVGIAPDDTGTYEGGDGKPNKPLRHNKWCVRECERSSVHKKGEAIIIPDWSQRQYNIPKKHNLTDTPRLPTGIVYK